MEDCHSPIGAYARLQERTCILVGVFELNGRIY